MRLNWYRFYEETVDGDGGSNGDGGSVGDPGGTPGGAPDGQSPGAGSTPADWPSDWRMKFSPDGKHTKTLDRFASPNAVFDSYMALRQKLDSGELKTVSPFPDKGTPEDQSAWRKAHGIPEKAEDYSLAFGDGLVVGDADKPFVDEFLKAAHASNMDTDQVKGVLGWYYGQQERAMAAQEQKDAEYLQASEDTLRAEWGGEFRTNINMLKGLVESMPESIRDIFMNARLGDGNALLNHPDMARWLVHTARTINPVHTVVPGAGANIASAIQDEIESIEKLMKDGSPEYWNNDKTQARLRDLYDARERSR